MRNDFSTVLIDSFQGSFATSYFLVVLLVGICIQGTKLIIDLIRLKKFDIKNIFVAGGFPSAHSGLATSVTTLAMFEYGLFSVVFAITFTFSLLFAYDAMNIRFQAGEQARYINKLRRELGGVLDTNKTKTNLKERMGHTPIEVFGGVFFGFILTSVFYMIFIIN